MHLLVLGLCLAGCVDDSMRIVFEGEYTETPYEVGVGLPVRVDVVQGTGVDESTPFADDELAIVAVVGGTRCPGLCVIPDGTASSLELTIETPDGTRVTGRRNVASALKLSMMTPNWGRAPVDRIHLEAGATSRRWLVVRNATSGALVAGTLPSYEITGDITLDAFDVIAGAPGTATIGSITPPIAPLEIRIITPSDSLASLATLHADRVWTEGRGRDTLTAYTKGPVGAVLFDGFDVDGYLVLPGLPLDVIGGPHVVARAYPVDTVPCTTNAYCFLRGALDENDPDTVTSFVDVRGGPTTQRFEVRVIRGEY